MVQTDTAILAISLTVAVHWLKKPFVYAGFNNSNTDGHRFTQMKTQQQANPPLTPPKGGTISRTHPAQLPSLEGMGVGRFMGSRSRSIRKVVLATALGLTMIALCGCGTAKVAGRRETSAAPATKPAVIYVADFDLDAASIKSEPGALAALPKVPGPLGSILPPPPGAPKDPDKLARELVDSMSATLVKDLTKAGLTARRLPTGEPLPTAGWLVRGVFTDVNQGNQLRRAVIGFGVGKTDLQVLVDINDLAHGAPRRFYELNTTADSGKAPGAGPMIVLNPAAGAARFVIVGKDLNLNVKQTASKISTEVAQRCEANKTTLTAEAQ